MSARRRSATKLLISLALAFAAGCAHGGESRGGTAAVYENGQGARIILSPDAITIGGVAHPLTDCSDADHVCRTSDVGFHVSFPRRCPAGSWFAEEGPMKYIGGIGTYFIGRYVNRDHSSFEYHWEPRNGLVAFFHDPARDFAALPPNYARSGQTVSYRRSGPRIFACS